MRYSFFPIVGRGENTHKVTYIFAEFPPIAPVKSIEKLPDGKTIVTIRECDDCNERCRPCVNKHTCPCCEIKSSYMEFVAIARHEPREVEWIKTIYQELSKGYSGTLDEVPEFFRNLIKGESMKLNFYV